MRYRRSASERLAGVHSNKHMSNKTLNYAEYQEKIKSITSSEEAAAFAQEMLAPVLAGLKTKAEPEELVATPGEPKKKSYKRTSVFARAARIDPETMPWFDAVTTPTEARARCAPIGKDIYLSFPKRKVRFKKQCDWSIALA